MDDYSISTLIESKNEWCSRLVTTLTPALIDGINSIFNEAYKLCEDNDELEKYLMTFQTFLSRIPQWNPNIIDDERKRIEERTGCDYLDELIACVHIVQLKALTCVRVGQKQKKIDIDIPPINDFIHKIYHNLARKIYANIYLFEKNIAPLQIQKYNKELERIVKECIMNTIRENMPIETILKAYIDESYEENIEVKEEIVPSYENDIETLPSNVIPMNKPSVESFQSNEEKLDIKAEAEKLKKQQLEQILENAKLENNQPDTQDLQSISNKMLDDANININISDDSELAGPLTPRSQVSSESSITPRSPLSPISPESLNNNNIQFSDVDNRISDNGIKENVYVSKDLDNLDRISKMHDSEDDDESDDEILQIGDNIDLDIIDVNDLSRPKNITNSPLLNDIEILT